MLHFQVVVFSNRFRRSGGFSLLAFLLALASPAAAQSEFPGAGTDSFESEMTVLLDVVGLGEQEINLKGPTTVQRGDPVQVDGENCKIDTEIIAMTLEADHPVFGKVVVRNDPERSSVGEVISHEESCTFLADSFFDVFVVVEIEGPDTDGAVITATNSLMLTNNKPVRVSTSNVKALPPLFDTYTHPPPAIPLVPVGNPSGTPLATILGESTHRPVQEPSFSINTGGVTTTLDPADILGIANPPLPRIPKTNLGLVQGDNLDALSYGVDVFGEKANTTVAFSVDAQAVGSANTGVNREAANGEALGDEFASYFNDTNLELVDEQVLVFQIGNPGDDLDALTNQPPRYADGTGDTVPDRPVYFSLAPGSPTLTSLGARAGDILVFTPGVGLSIYARIDLDMGLLAGDVLDALCLMKAGLPNSGLIAGGGSATIPPTGNAMSDWALFSLAPGSPSVGANVSAADLLVTNFNAAGVGPSASTLYAPASEIGLLTSDNLNALKCLDPAISFFITGVPLTDGKVIINAGVPRNTGNPFEPAPGASLWLTSNPRQAHTDGPFAYPDAADDCGQPVLDPTQLFWSFPDQCGVFHIHNVFPPPSVALALGAETNPSQSPHFDPDPVCGHGGSVALYGPAVSIAADDSPTVVAQKITDGINQDPDMQNLRITAAWHARQTIPGPVVPLGAGIGEDEQAVVVVTGTGLPRFDLMQLGADGLSVSAPGTTLPIPLVEADADGDGVPDRADNCVEVPNPVLGSPGQPARESFQTTTGGQLDDDGDGFGNPCDAKFGTPGQFVGGVDVGEHLASFNKDRSGSNCGISGTAPCAQFDLDNAGQIIGGTDILKTFQLFNQAPGPKCDACPLACAGPNCP